MSYPPSAPEPRPSYRWVILIVGILAYATSHFARQNYAGIQTFIIEDFEIDRGILGLLGAVFFYSYALFQLPWGIASDRFGSRGVTTVGILLTAVTMVGFARSQSAEALLFWRAAAGIAGAAAFVAISGGVARWFPPQERGVSQSAFNGMGGALGEGTAFFLLPVVSIYFAAGWREGTNAIAAAIALMGVLFLISFRSAPAGRPATTRTPLPRQLLRDPQLWCYLFLFAAFISGIRTAQAWIAIYMADVYASAHGLEVNSAVVSAGVFATVAYSLLGRGLGVPVAGTLSDALVKRGIPRSTFVIAWLVVALVLFQVLSMQVTTIWILAIVAVLLGTAVNSYPLISASVSEAYGPERTASIMGFINMAAQVSGATALAASGYVGIALSGDDTGALAEYRGIWLSSMVVVGIMGAVGVALHVALRYRAAPAPAVAPTAQ